MLRVHRTARSLTRKKVPSEAVAVVVAGTAVVVLRSKNPRRSHKPQQHQRQQPLSHRRLLLGVADVLAAKAGEMTTGGTQ